MITIKDIARMRIEYIDRTDSLPNRVVLSHYEYDCIRNEYMYGDACIGVEMPLSCDYKGGGELFGMRIYLANDVEFKCMIG